jgi:chorismate mutase
MPRWSICWRSGSNARAVSANSRRRRACRPGGPDREIVQVERLRALAKSAKLDPEFAEKFSNLIIAEVIRHHESIRED